jgi:predicted hydrocarbon binding protein
MMAVTTNSQQGYYYGRPVIKSFHVETYSDVTCAVESKFRGEVVLDHDARLRLARQIAEEIAHNIEEIATMEIDKKPDIVSGGYRYLIKAHFAVTPVEKL